MSPLYQNMSRKSLRITFRSTEYKLSWYPGTSDSGLRETIRELIQLPPDTHLVLLDNDGCIVAVNQNLPDGLHLKVEVRNSSNTAMVEDPKGSNSQHLTSATSFRGELLKFERINAHLANERTWLAWVRTALSTLSCAFAFLSLSSSGTYEVFVYVLGSLFCLSVLFVYVTGWLRYTRIKLILGLSFSEMKNKFDRIGITWVARLFGGLFVCTSVIYWLGAWSSVKNG